MTLKECRECGKTKPITSFYKYKGYRDGHYYICKICKNISGKEYYEKNKVKIERKRKVSYKDARNDCIKYYSNGLMECMCCGEQDMRFLALDHMNNDGAEKRRNKDHPNGGMHFYRWLIVNNFPPGFQVLCMNCNWGKHQNNGVCPHKSQAKGNK